MFTIYFFSSFIAHKRKVPRPISIPYLVIKNRCSTKEKGRKLKMSNPIVTAVSKDNNHVFHSDIQKGEYGEYLVKKYLHKHYQNRIIYAEDKTGVKKYQKADIDFLLQFEGQAIQSVEVKNDNTLYPNLFYETVSVSKEGREDTPGCMVVTEADVLFYVYEALNVTVIVPLASLRQWVKEFFDSGGVLEEKTVFNAGYQARGYGMPLQKLMGDQGGWAAAEGIKVVDMQTNCLLTFDEYDLKRRRLLKKTNGQRYVKTMKEKAWSSKNQRIWPNREIGNIPLKSDLERHRNAIIHINKWIT